jgi:hypothetical protein
MTRMSAMRKFCLSLMILAAASFFASELHAQNPVYFPYVVNDGNTVTELLFTNATSRDASVTLTGYSEDGTAVSGPALVIPGNAQAVVSSFSGLSGWVLAKQRAGSVTFASVQPTAAQAEPAQPNTTIILPFVAQTGGARQDFSRQPSPSREPV